MYLVPVFSPLTIQFFIVSETGVFILITVS